MLGSAETVGAQADLFALVDKRHRIYARSRPRAAPSIDVRRAEHARADSAAPARTRQPSSRAVEQLPAERGQPPHPRPLRPARRDRRRRPADRPVPRPDRAVPRAGARRREPQPAEDGARRPALGLRTAVHAARKTRARRSARSGLRVERDGHGWRRRTSRSSRCAAARRATHFLVLFERRAPPARRPRTAPSPGPQARRKRRASADRPLQRELAATREYLQSIIQELEATNEELQSANEEILSSNEELQSTNEELDTAKEELQSTNEELNTVNEELHNRNDELEPRQQRLDQPARQRPDRHRHGRHRPAHPPLHPDGREGAQPDPDRRRPAHQRTSSPTSTCPTSRADRRGASTRSTPSSARCRIAAAAGTSLRVRPYRTSTTGSTARCWRCSTSTRSSGSMSPSAPRSRSLKRSFETRQAPSPFSIRKCIFARQALASRNCSRCLGTTAGDNVRSRILLASMRRTSRCERSRPRRATARWGHWLRRSTPSMAGSQSPCRHGRFRVRQPVGSRDSIGSGPKPPRRERTDERCLRDA